MKILAIDYGKKRIGLAVGDTEYKIAFSRGIIKNTPRLYGDIRKICCDDNIEKIVVGLPLSLKGGYTQQTKETTEFIEKVREQTGIFVDVLDERLSSVQAGKIAREIKGKKYVDDIAASLILEQYFEQAK